MSSKLRIMATFNAYIREGEGLDVNRGEGCPSPRGAGYRTAPVPIGPGDVQAARLLHTNNRAASLSRHLWVGRAASCLSIPRSGRAVLRAALVCSSLASYMCHQGRA